MGRSIPCNVGGRQTTRLGDWIASGYCRRLARERGEPLLEGGFAIAERFHMWFYDPARFYPVTADGDPQNSHEMVAQFVHLVLDMLRAS